MANAVWHGESFKRHCHGNEKEVLLKIGYEIERQGKLNITESIYDRPQRGSYKRTGAARASIHTIFEASEMACYIGSDTESLNKARVAASSTGSNIFYFRWLEDGFHTRKGRFISGHHMLKRALDSVKAGLR